MKDRIIGLLGVAIVVVCDQLTKNLISADLKVGQSVALLEGYVHLTLVHNTGAAFSMLRNKLWLLIFLAVIAVMLLLVYFPKIIRYGKCAQVGVVLLLGGTVGNLIDRIVHRYVVDFVDLRIWPVFNVADAAISVGALMVALVLLRKDSIGEKKQSGI